MERLPCQNESCQFSSTQIYCFRITVVICNISLSVKIANICIATLFSVSKHVINSTIGTFILNSDIWLDYNITGQSRLVGPVIMIGQSVYNRNTLRGMSVVVQVDYNVAMAYSYYYYGHSLDNIRYNNKTHWTL